MKHGEPTCASDPHGTTSSHGDVRSHAMVCRVFRLLAILLIATSPGLQAAQAESIKDEDLNFSLQLPEGFVADPGMPCIEIARDRYRSNTSREIVPSNT
jgi:hypothetical protein